MPTIAFTDGTRARNRVSRALRLRSPRDTPLPLPMNVLLLRWDTKPAAHQEDVPTSCSDTQNVFLCRRECAATRAAVTLRTAWVGRCAGNSRRSDASTVHRIRSPIVLG